MTSRSELRRLAVQAGEPMPEFPPVPPGADHPSAPGASTAASSSPPRGDAADRRAIEGDAPSPLAPAPEAQSPALGAPGSSSALRPRLSGGGPDSSPEGEASECAPASPSGSTARTWTVELPAGLRLLSLNGREHWSARNRAAQSLKKAAWAMTVNAKVPRLERIGVQVLYDPPDRRRRDHDNLGATLKPLIDGIVAAGVVSDDDTGHVAPPLCEITGTVHPRGRLRIVISELAGSPA